MESILNPPEATTKAFVRASNRQDVDNMNALMSLGHRFVDSLGNQVEGRDTMRKDWTAYFAMVPDYTVAIEETCALGPEDVTAAVDIGCHHDWLQRQFLTLSKEERRASPLQLPNPQVYFSYL